MTNTDSAKDHYGRVIPAGCKNAKLNLGDAWRTTYTHIVPGDVVRMDDVNGEQRPAGTAARKSSRWLKVASVTRGEGGVTITFAQDWGKTTSAAHTAITRQERPEEYEARVAAADQARLDSIAEHASLVTITGTHVHRETRGGRAWCPVTVLDGDEISDDATRVTCPVCLVADTVPAEVVADAVYSYEADSYVVYCYSEVTGKSVPVPVADLAAYLAAEAVPVRVPATEPQRRAIRVISWAEAEGTAAVTHSATLKTLIRDGWMAKGSTNATNTLTGDARAWLDSEHTAEVTTHVHGGVTLYGATCNCGTGHENSRMARRVPWSSAMLTSAEDAVAVALGHGTVSRPRYDSSAVTLAVGDRVAVLADWTEDGVELPGTVTVLDSSAVWVEHAPGCAPLAYGAEQLRKLGPGEVLAEQEAALTEPEAGTCVHCGQAVAHVHGLWIAAGVAECAENLGGAHEVHLHRCEWTGKVDPRVIVVPGCGMCALESPEISVTDARITAEAVACEECGIMPHDVECLTGLRLDSPTPTVDDVAAMVGNPVGWVTEQLLHEPRTLHDDELVREHAYWETLKVAASLTPEDVAGLPTAESAAAAHNAGVAWAPKGGKRKASSVAVKRSRQLAGQRR